MQVNWNGNKANEERKPSEFWVNVGMMNGDQFIAIGGFPLDSAEMKGNGEFAQLQRGLVASFKQVAETLDPGENTYCIAGQFTLQIKRTGGEQANSVPALDLSRLFSKR